MQNVLVLAALALAGCGEGNTVDAGPGGALDAGSGRIDAGVDAGLLDAGIADAGLPDAGGSDGGVDGGVPPIEGEVAFVVMGDTGEGNDEQRAVAAAIDAFCATERCDFVILLGDNFYDSGVTSVTDAQWEDKFEAPYRDIDLPFYAVLGNHDYGGVIGVCPLCTEQGGLGNQFDRGPIEVEYTTRSEKWTMPDTFYTFQVGPVGFVMLDTNSILWDDTSNGDQAAWYRDAVADLRASGSRWIVGAGHHPYLSNGAHGNAGSYESVEIAGMDVPIPVPIMDGRNVLSFFDTYVCGDVDVYLAGHDHNRQWLNEPTACGGTELVVSGAGAKVKDFDSDLRNATHFADATMEGFFHVSIDGDTFIGRFVNRAGTVEYERMFERAP